MMKRLKICLYLVVGVCFSPSLGAQPQWRFQEVNAKTLAYFYKKNWAGLIQYGEKSIQKGMDFYGLRYRLGVAYYEQKDYWRSTRHFENTLRFNRGDYYAQEYLYYSYLFTGRENDALLLSKEFNRNLKKKIGIKKFKPLNFIYLESGIKSSNLRDSIGNLYYGTIGIEHRIGYRLKVYHAFSYLNQNYLGTELNQYEYYLKTDAAVAKGLSLISAFHYLKANGLKGSEFANSSVSTNNGDGLSQQIFVGFVGLKKSLGRLTLTPFAVYSNLKVTANANMPANPSDPVLSRSTSRNDQWQLGLDGQFVLPVFKSKLTLGGSAFWLNQEGDNTLLWKVKVHLQLLPKLAVQGDYLHSGRTNFAEDYASIFYNSTSPLDYRFSSMLTYQVAPRLIWYFLYQREQKTETNFNFYYNSLLTGIKINL